MGKIGDLFVRLGLKKDEYSKGIEEAKKENDGFGKSLGKMKAGALAVWAAVGTAVVAFAKEMIDGTNRIGDAWQRTSAQMKAGWDVFIQSVSNWDWDNFIGRIKESAAAAKDLQNALDFEFEARNSINLQKAMMSEELAQLQIDMRDQNKTYQERIDAANQYLDKVKPLYQQEIDLLQSLKDAYATKWLSGTTLDNTKEMRQFLEQFLIDYGKNADLIDAVAKYNDKNSSKEVWEKARDYIEQYGRETGNYAAATLAKIYETMRGDKDTVPLVKAIQDFYNAKAALQSENRRVITAKNTALAGLKSEMDETKGKLLESAKEVLAAAGEVLAARELFTPIDSLNGIKTPGVEQLQPQTIPDLIPDDWLERNREKIDAVIAEKERLMQAGQLLSDALIYGTQNALDELANAIAGVEGSNVGTVMKALLSPLADAAIQAGMLIMTTGEGIEALKAALTGFFGVGAIAAGAILVGVGVAAKAGLAAIGGGKSASAGAVSSYNSSGYGSYKPTVEEQELTIYIKGELKGSDIVLAADRTKKNWGR